MVSDSGISSIFRTDVIDAVGQTLIPLLIVKLGVEKDPEQLKAALFTAIDCPNPAAVKALSELLHDVGMHREDEGAGTYVDTDGQTALARAEAAATAASSPHARAALYSIIHQLTLDDGGTGWLPITAANATPTQSCRLRALEHLAAVSKDVAAEAGAWLAAPSGRADPPLIEFVPAAVRAGGGSYATFKKGWVRVLEALCEMLRECVGVGLPGHRYHSEWSRHGVIPSPVNVAKALRFRSDDWASSHAKFYFEKGGTVEFAIDALLATMAKQQLEGARLRLEANDLGILKTIKTPVAPTHPFETADYLRCAFIGADYPPGPHAESGSTKEDDGRWRRCAQVLRRRGVSYRGVCMMWRFGSGARHGALSQYVL